MDIATTREIENKKIALELVKLITDEKNEVIFKDNSIETKSKQIAEAFNKVYRAIK